MSSGSLTHNAVRAAIRTSEYQFAEFGPWGHDAALGRTGARTGFPTPTAHLLAPHIGDGWPVDKEQAKKNNRNRQFRPYTVIDPNEFSLARFAKQERLHAVFRILEESGGHGAGPDGLTYGDFSPTEIYAALRAVREDIQVRSYRPARTRSVSIPKGNGQRRELQLNCIIDRVVAKGLQLALSDYWGSQLPRCRQDVWDVWVQMDREIRHRMAFVLVTDDVRNCFPTAPIDLVMSCHRQHINDSSLQWLVDRIVRGHAGPDHQIGLYQGSPYSPVAMDLTLHHTLDSRLEAEHQGFPLLLRYADNLSYQCSSASEGLTALQVCSDILSESGFSLKNQDGPPVDIRDEHDRVVLGLIPQWTNGQLAFVIPESAFDHLQEGFTAATLTKWPLHIASRVATGWLNAVGPSLTSAVLQTVVDKVIGYATNSGFCELRSRRKELNITGRSARSRWLTRLERGVRTHG